jgi:hypothetical protein
MLPSVRSNVRSDRRESATLFVDMYTSLADLVLTASTAALGLAQSSLKAISGLGGHELYPVWQYTAYVLHTAQLGIH